MQLFSELSVSLGLIEHLGDERGDAQSGSSGPSGIHKQGADFRLRAAGGYPAQSDIEVAP
jgi:hypothetical protein